MMLDNHEPAGVEATPQQIDAGPDQIESHSAPKERAQPESQETRSSAPQERIVVARHPQHDKVWYTKREAADYLRVSVWTIQLWMRLGKIKPHRLQTSVSGHNAVGTRTGRDYRRVRFHIDELNRVAGLNRSDWDTPAGGQTTYSEEPQLPSGPPLRNTASLEPGQVQRMASARKAIRPITFKARYEHDYGENLITKFMAAIILDVDVRTVERYINEQALHEVERRKGPDGFVRQLLSRAEVEALLGSHS
jgi:hypothetical protein